MKVSSGGSGAVALTTLLAPISWGTTYWVVTEALPADHPLLIAAVRVVPAGLLLVAVGLLSSGWRPRGREWAHIAALSLLNFGLFMPLLVAATYRVPGGVIASFAGLQPLLVVVGTALLVRVAPGRIELAIGLAAAVGVLLVVGSPTGSLDPLGLLLAFGANVSFAAGVILTKRLPAPRDRVASTGWQLLLSGIVIVPLAIVVEGVPATLSEMNLAGFAYLSIAATGVASVLWFRGIHRLPVAAPPLLGLASAVTGVVVGWLALGQSLTLPQSVGFLVTLGAIAYGATMRRTERSADGASGRSVPDQRRLGELTPVPMQAPLPPSVSRMSPARAARAVRPR